MMQPLLDGAMPVRGAAHQSSSSSAAIPSANKPSCGPAAVASAVSPHLPPTNSGQSLGFPLTVLFLRCANFGAHRLFLRFRRLVFSHLHGSGGLAHRIGARRSCIWAICACSRTRIGCCCWQ